MHAELQFTQVRLSLERSRTQPLYGPEPRWIGIIHARTPTDAWTISQTDELVIRTEEGREGRFTFTSGGDLSSSELMIAGYGSPPFDDEAEPDPA
ncbi:hypothetical protein ABZ379_05975 [Streptomyces canus]|uniref:hypothetical protein n=1 Tax=Streptomyces canus TaxID=58343 RepID=UPI0033DB6CE3